MPLPTLTWNRLAESTIPCAGATVTYAELLNKMKTVIDASTYWKATLSLDAGNTRGWIELAPKSTDASIKDGRLLFVTTDGTVTGAAGSERPLTTYRQAPWNTGTTSLTPKSWVGFSPNAGTTGPANDPWSNVGQPYSTWSKFLPVNITRPGLNQVMGFIESAESCALYWSHATAGIIGFHFGRILESLDSEAVKWGLVNLFLGTSDIQATATNAWSVIPASIDAAPIGAGSVQHSAGSTARAAAIAQDTDGTLYGFGRTGFDSISSGGTYQTATEALFVPILLSGGVYANGSTDAPIGTLRQVRWGPPALRGQRLDSAGVPQGYHLNFSASTVTKNGLWFDNFRS